MPRLGAGDHVDPVRAAPAQASGLPAGAGFSALPAPHPVPCTACFVGTDAPVHAQTLAVFTELREGAKAPLTRPRPVHAASSTWPSAIALGHWLPSKASLAEAHACVTPKESYFVNDMPLWSPQDPPRGAGTKV